MCTAHIWNQWPLLESNINKISKRSRIDHTVIKKSTIQQTNHPQTARTFVAAMFAERNCTSQHLFIQLQFNDRDTRTFKFTKVRH